MIRWNFDNSGALILEQWFEEPTVYLDHWALRRLSEDQNTADRFVRALKGTKGTLMLSWVNVAEFIRLTDRFQTRAAEVMVDRVTPNVFFLEASPLVVTENEGRLAAGQRTSAPHADTDSLRAFVCLKPKSPKPFTAQGLFTGAQKPQLGRRLCELEDTILEEIDRMRNKMDTDREFVKQVNRPAPGLHDECILRATRYLFRELIRPLLNDRSLRPTRNDAIDLLHAVVPLAYCDIVLLDKHWKAQADRVRQQLRRRKMNMPIAKVYSGRRDEIEQFLRELESWDT